VPLQLMTAGTLTAEGGHGKTLVGDTTKRLLNHCLQHTKGANPALFRTTNLMFKQRSQRGSGYQWQGTASACLFPG
jgi:hypothetical protein